MLRRQYGRRSFGRTAGNIYLLFICLSIYLSVRVIYIPQAIYLPLGPDVQDAVTETWRALDSVRGEAGHSEAGGSCGDNDDEEGEEGNSEGDLRGWLQELRLARGEQDTLCELAREAPSRVQLWHNILKSSL